MDIDTTLLGPAATAIGVLVSGVAAYVLGRNMQPLAPTSKLWDRAYELEKLALAYPKDFERFMAERHRSTPYFYAQGATQDEAFWKLKALVYLQLDIFEEMYLTTRGSSWVARLFERGGWDAYILRKLRHPLIREVFDRESRLLYEGAFRRFVEQHRAEIERPLDPADQTV